MNSVSVTFVAPDDSTRTVRGEPGQSVMALAVAHGVPGIDGDCGGSMACGTCHVQVHPDWWNRTGGPSEFESSLIEVAIDPGPRSRLGCQIVLTPDLDGLTVTVPQAQKA